MAGDGPLLRLDRITKRFGDFTALDSVSLDVDRGEFVVFLGPSGCGKTTLLRIIAGLEPQTGGLIHQDGHEISALPPGRRDYGIVFQSYALFPNLTVFDNVAYGLKSERRGEASRRGEGRRAARHGRPPRRGRQVSVAALRRAAAANRRRPSDCGGARAASPPTSR